MNEVFISGRLTKDPEIRQAGETSIVRFTTAVDRAKEGADFISCVAFNKTAETISKYTQKGSKLFIKGHIQTGSYDDKNGNKVYTTDVIVDRFEFAESKSEKMPPASDNVFMNIPDAIDEELPFN